MELKPMPPEYSNLLDSSLNQEQDIKSILNLVYTFVKGYIYVYDFKNGLNLLSYIMKHFPNKTEYYFNDMTKNYPKIVLILLFNLHINGKDIAIFNTLPFHNLIVGSYNENFHQQVINFLRNMNLSEIMIKQLNFIAVSNTPLHSAAKRNLVDYVQYLVSLEGIKLNLKNREGKTPISLTTNENIRKDIIAAMIKFLTKNFQDSYEIRRIIGCLYDNGFDTFELCEAPELKMNMLNYIIHYIPNRIKWYFEQMSKNNDQKILLIKLLFNLNDQFEPIIIPNCMLSLHSLITMSKQPEGLSDQIISFLTQNMTLILGFVKVSNAAI